MSTRFHGDTTAVPSTTRIEAFSDGVFAILITLLILEVEVPFLPEHPSFLTVIDGIIRTLPHLLSFAFSFFTLAVFWVNHHHFFSVLGKTDWVLLWHNMHLLFWLALVPFTTAFLGEHPDIPIVVSLYALNLMLAAIAFTMMTHHALFHGCFTNGDIAEKDRKEFVGRAVKGASAYALAAVVAFGSPWVAWGLIVAIPTYYVVPRLMRR